MSDDNGFDGAQISPNPELPHLLLDMCQKQSQNEVQRMHTFQTRLVSWSGVMIASAAALFYQTTLDYFSPEGIQETIISLYYLSIIVAWGALIFFLVQIFKIERVIDMRGPAPMTEWLEWCRQNANCRDMANEFLNHFANSLARAEKSTSDACEERLTLFKQAQIAFFIVLFCLLLASACKGIIDAFLIVLPQ